MNFLCVIPARENSQRIKNKNIFKIKNKPLIKYTFDQVIKSKYLNKIIVSTDSKFIQNYSLKNNIDCPFLRPKNISGKNALSYSVVKHAYNFLKKKSNIDYKYVILLQPTSPLRQSKHIDEACKKILADSNADCLVSTCSLSEYIDTSLIMKKNNKYLTFVNYDKYKKINSIRFSNRKKAKSNTNVMIDNFVLRNGPAILITKTKNLEKFLIGGNILNYDMPLINSLDINNYNDLDIFKKYLNNNSRY